MLIISKRCTLSGCSNYNKSVNALLYLPVDKSSVCLIINAVLIDGIVDAFVSVVVDEIFPVVSTSLSFTFKVPISDRSLFKM